MTLEVLLLLGLTQAPVAIERQAVSSVSLNDQAVAALNDAEVQSQGENQTGAEQQPNAEGKKPPTPPHTGLRALFGGVVDDFKNLPSITNLYLLAGGGAVALAVHPFDSSLNARLRSHYALVNDIYAPARYFGGTPMQVGLSMATYGWGRLFAEPKVSHLGMDLLQAQIVTEILVETMKIAVRRDRPDNSQGSWNFSFPSGHSAQTFAAATVIERHLGWKKAILAYAIAAYVASSRLHDNVHFASDVAFGAAVGTVAAHTVTRHGPNAWTLIPTNVPGGAAIIVMRVQ